MAYEDCGSIIAADGWRLEWDIRELPHRIDVFNAAAVPQYRISGDIGRRYLEREAANFRHEHALQQLEMEM